MVAMVSTFGARLHRMDRTTLPPYPNFTSSCFGFMSKKKKNGFPDATFEQNLKRISTKATTDRKKGRKTARGWHSS